MNAMNPPGEQISDYARFDFEALWPGREKVTQVEGAILAAALRSGDRRRVLEVGTGFGRLLGVLTELAEEVVTTDFDLAGLSRLPSTGTDRNSLRVACNVYHLPFVGGSFSSASMIRVYHHLSEPVVALREVARVLRPGGRLLISYNPKPSVGTLVNDIQRAIHPSREAPFRSITFSAGRTSLHPDPFPVFVAGRRDFVQSTAAAGLHRGPEVVSGLEEYYFMRHIPAHWFVRIGTALGRAPAFPMRFALVTKPGADSASLPKLGEVLACPRCGTPHPDWGTADALECGHCPFVGRRHDAVLDLRYVPEGATRWEAPT